MRLSSRTARAALLILFVAALSVFAALPGSTAPSVRPARAAVSAGDARTAAPSLLAPLPLAKAPGAVFAPFATLLPQAAPGPEAVSTFASDCQTPKTDWSLGETVCVKVDGVPALSSRALFFINPNNYVVDKIDVSPNAASYTFNLPGAATATINGAAVDNRGTWVIGSVDPTDASIRALAAIVVHNPPVNGVEQPVADLQVNKTPVSGNQAVAGQNITFTINVFNLGPDTAQNAKFTDLAPANTTIVGLTQLTGPAFTCDATGAASRTCSGGTLARNQGATFSVVYLVSSTIPNGTDLTDTTAVSSDTAERRADDNSSSESTSASNPTPPACTMACPTNITVDSAPGQAGAIVNYDAPATQGTCGAVTTDHPSGSFFPVGTTLVTASTGNGVSCSFFVTVNPESDTTNPSISCPGDITVSESSPAANSATVNYSPAASDNSGSVVVDCDPPSGSAFAVGTTPVQCTATDPSGNSATCSFNVTVTQIGCDLDANSAPPVPKVASLPTITGACSVTLLPTDDPNATDACGGNINAETASERVYDSPGTYTVVWTYTDSAGHVTTQNQTIIIQPDNSAPVPDVASLQTVTGECSVTVTPPTATDNCAGVLTGVTPDPITYTTVGTHTVNWTYTDAAGNATTQTQTVVVTDTHAPDATLVGPDTVTVECHTSYTDQGATATDNCSAAPTLSSTSDVNVNAPGTYHVAWTATDGGGNTDTATRTVIVTDTIKPVITLNGASTMTVECHTSFTDPSASASDSCDATVPVSVSGAVNVNVVGPYTLTYTASDDSGNAAVPVTRTVNVVDTTAPVVTLNGAASVTIILGSSYSEAGATASDGCAGTLPVSTSGAVNTNAVGTYIITYSATDPSGNTGTATRTVNVIFNFTGFFSPVSNTALNQANAGRSIPVKFSLAGNQGLGIMAAGSPYSQQVSCGSNNPTDLQETGTAGSSSLTYDSSSNQYIYVWKSESSWAGTCRVLTVALIDGTTHTANFKFK